MNFLISNDITKSAEASILYSSKQIYFWTMMPLPLGIISSNTRESRLYMYI